MLLLLVQVRVLDHIVIGGTWVVLFIYPLAILKLPVNYSKITTMLIGFALGFVIDCFTGTYGLNASCGMMLGYARPFIVRLISGRDEMDENITPSVSAPSLRWFLSLCFFGILVHSFWYFNFAQFNLSGLFKIQLRAILSALCSFVIIVLADILFSNPKKR